jgi:hypothetical protein
MAPDSRAGGLVAGKSREEQDREEQDREEQDRKSRTGRAGQEEQDRREEQDGRAGQTNMTLKQSDPFRDKPLLHLTKEARNPNNSWAPRLTTNLYLTGRSTDAAALGATKI